MKAILLLRVPYENKVKYITLTYTLNYVKKRITYFTSREKELQEKIYNNEIVIEKIEENIKEIKVTIHELLELIKELKKMGYKLLYIKE